MAGDANGELASTTSAAPLQQLSMAPDARPPPRKEERIRRAARCGWPKGIGEGRDGR